jgi:hypothetical protein
MSQVENRGCGCGCLTLLLLLFVWSIGTIIFWLVNIFASIGTTVILLIDSLANIFTGIGVQNPAIGWLLLGLLFGGTLGLTQGLKHTGRSSDIYKVYLVAMAVFFMLQTVAYSKWQSQFDLRTFQNVVVQETFTSPKNWRLTEGAVIKDGGLFQIQPKGSDFGWSSWEGKILSDVDFSAEVVKVNGPDNLYFGLLARVKEGENPSFYYLKINGDGYFVMGKYSSLSWDDRVDAEGSGIINIGNSKNRLRLICKDNLIMGFINDKMVGIFRDTSYKLGTIAVQSSRGEESGVAVYFDNVLVKEKSQ